MAAGGAVPVIETERLRLRSIHPGDLPLHAEALSDPEVVRYLGGHTLPREEAWRKLLSGHAMWSMFGYGYWAVERREDGAYLGMAGFGDFKRDMTPAIQGSPEMGWVFTRQSHGKGYASEAVAAGLAWADGALRGQEITAIIDAANAASIRVAEKAGFSTCEPAEYRGEPILLFRRPPRA